MNPDKSLFTSSLAHTASLFQTRRDKTLGIKDIKHWSALDSALDQHRSETDFFAVHHSEPKSLAPILKPAETILALDSDDDSSNGGVDYIMDEVDNHVHISQKRLHGTPMLQSPSNSLLNTSTTFVDLSSNNDKVRQKSKASPVKPYQQSDKATQSRMDMVILPSVTCGKQERSSPTNQKYLLKTRRHPVVVHRGLSSRNSNPDFSPISFKLLCANDMPGPIICAPLSGSPLQHPFRGTNKKIHPTGNVEDAIQVFKVNASPPELPSAKLKICPKNGAKGTATTSAALEASLYLENAALPPLGEGSSHEYWANMKPMEQASRFVTQPPRDYGLIIHLALNRPK
jgi:hypothetical protein